jgi:calcineurin-like phosphoesterase family protein
VSTHNDTLISRINSKVKKADKLFILGDIVFRRENLHYLAQINSRHIHLVLGNHDTEYFNVRDYLPYAEKVSGMERHGKFWLTHAPIHPCELRGRGNIHGHVHSNDVLGLDGEIDRRYVNACVEALEGYPINIQDISNGYYWERRRYFNG